MTHYSGRLHRFNGLLTMSELEKQIAREHGTDLQHPFPTKPPEFWNPRQIDREALISEFGFDTQLLGGFSVTTYQQGDWVNSSVSCGYLKVQERNNEIRQIRHSTGKRRLEKIGDDCTTSQRTIAPDHSDNSLAPQF